MNNRKVDPAATSRIPHGALSRCRHQLSCRVNAARHTPLNARWSRDVDPAAAAQVPCSLDRTAAVTESHR